MPLFDGPCLPARAVVFDLDGTLVDSLPDLSEALNLALAEQGWPPVPAELVRTSLHDGLEGSVQAALAHLAASPDLANGVAERYALLYQARITRRTRAYPGVTAMLARLSVAGVRLGICTNKGEAQARQLLGHLDLAGYFDVVIGADTLSRRKPDPAPLRAAMARLGSVPWRALMVGDSRVDIECARAAGLACAVHAGGYGRFATAPEGVELFLDSYCGSDLDSLLAFVLAR